MRKDNELMWVLHYIVIIILIVAVIGLFLYAGLQRSEIVYCNKIKDYSRQYAHFYITQWEKDMCDHYGIEIHAPVGNDPYEF